MSATIATSSIRSAPSAGDELAALGWEINANQYRVVHLAARFDEELDWFRLGHRHASCWIAMRLQVLAATAREWIRVGHALRFLPLIDAAFAAQEISYAKVRILTRWADDDNEERLLKLARERTADRLTVAIAKVLADDGETDVERDARLHDERSFTTWTDGDGMTVLRVVLPPSVAKPVVAAVNELVRRIAETPTDPSDAAAVDLAAESAVDPAMGEAALEQPGLSADAFDEPSVVGSSPVVAVESEASIVGVDAREADLSADACGRRNVGESSPIASESLRVTLRELRRRWQPDVGDDWVFPSVAQQRADAFVALFLGSDVSLSTEVVVHVRGDGVSFDDGTPTTSSAVVRQLDESFIRLLIHDADRRPINASSRRRHPTTRQKRVVMETHRHECVDCESTDLLELDHNPPFERTGRTVVEELEPRCAPCHRARHRHDRMAGPGFAA